MTSRSTTALRVVPTGEPEEQITTTGPIPVEVNQEETRKHIRGSSLLLLGRFLALGTHFITQVLLVRALEKSQFGAFAYALSLISIGKSIALFGFDKSITRFVPIHYEKRDFDRMFGTIVLMFGTVVSLGVGVVLTIYGLREWLSPALGNDQEGMALLLILIILSPIEALESLLTGMFAIFSSPRAIFFQKNLLGPQSQLLVVLVVLILGHSNVYFVAFGYVAAGLLGVVVYANMLLRVLREQGMLAHFNRATLKLPSREILSFTLPLLVSDVVFVLRSSLIVVLLEYFKNNTEVAHYRAVLPVARLNGLVYHNFMVLFMPAASRMFARNDRPGINTLYWQTAIWIAVISFPIFAVSFGFAQPLTVLLFGNRYADSAVVLMLLSAGYYFNCVLGFNGLSLRVFGRVRYMFGVDLGLAIITIAASLLLIPRYGAVGAAIVAAGTLIAQNVFYQVGLISSKSIKWLSLKYVKVYLIILSASLVLLVLPPIYASFAGVIAVSLFVLLLSHKSLSITQTFPELLRLPLVRRILGDHDSSSASGEFVDTSKEVTVMEYLRRNANSYFAEFKNAEVDVKLISEVNRTKSKIYRFQLASNGHARVVRLKVPTQVRKQDRINGRPKADRPRRFSVTDLGKKFQFEYSALSHIRQHFDSLRDPRFGTVNILDSLPVLRGNVMEELKDPSLNSLFVRENRLGLFKSSRTAQAFNNAGAWLSAYHSLQIDANCRHQTRTDFIEVNKKLSQYLASKTKDPRYFENLFSQVEASARRVLPESLPIGLNHGDYAMRNILVGATGRVTVLDTLACWRTAIYEDIGYFLTNLKVSWPQIISQGLVFKQSLLEHHEEAFLAGYFDKNSVPLEAIRLYEIQALLDRWSGRVARCDELADGALVRKVVRLRLKLEARYYRKTLNHLIQSLF